MLCYRTLEEQDIDGNRGRLVTWAELESSDVEQVREEILQQYEPEVDEYTITLYSHLDSEHDFEVLASDYFTILELGEMNNAN